MRRLFGTEHMRFALPLSSSLLPSLSHSLSRTDARQLQEPSSLFLTQGKKYVKSGRISVCFANETDCPILCGHRARWKQGDFDDEILVRLDPGM